MSTQQIIAKALWADENAAKGHRPWASVRLLFMARAGKVLSALTANGLAVVERDYQDQAADGAGAECVACGGDGYLEHSTLTEPRYCGCPAGARAHGNDDNRHPHRLPPEGLGEWHPATATRWGHHHEVDAYLADHANAPMIFS